MTPHYSAELPEEGKPQLTCCLVCLHYAQFQGIDVGVAKVDGAIGLSSEYTITRREQQ